MRKIETEINLKAIITVLAKASITLLAFYFILRKSNSLVVNLFSKVNFDKTYLCVAFFLFVSQILFSTYRWHIIARELGSKISFLALLSIAWTAQFWVPFMPAGLAGDTYKIHKLDLRKKSGILSVLIDKFSALLGTMLISAAFFFQIINVYFGNITHVELNCDVIFILLISSMLLIISLVIFKRYKRSASNKLFQPLMITDEIKHSKFSVRKILTRLLRNSPYKSKVKLLFISVVSQINLIFAIYFLALGLNINAKLINFFTAIPIVIVLSSLPISFGGWGVREATMMLALAPFDISQTQSFQLGAAIGIVALLFSLLAGFSYFIIKCIPASPRVIFKPITKDQPYKHGYE